MAIGEAARYAGQRRQFGKAIASFGAIRQKIGEMAAREYAVEAMLYRTAGLIDGMLQEDHSPAMILAALEEFAIEASILKVASSETLDFILDENVQIHGGNGFVRDYPAERHYRDARVNRIFEGTNEINRLLIPGMLARRALKGGLPLIAAAKRLMDEIMSPSMDAAGDGTFDAERRAVTAMKKVGLMVLGTAMQTYGEKLADEQEVLIAAADIIIETFASESALLRAAQNGGDLHAAAAKVYVNDAAGRIEQSAKTALAAMADGDTLRTLLAALRRLLKVTPINTVVLRRQLADATVERRTYVF
jgi:alkylation response protein AidB-like acyl-CoA dehydrogenase